MAYDQVYLNSQGSYDSFLSDFVLVPTPLDATSTPMSSRRRQSFISASSDFESEWSMVSSGPVTPPLHTQHGLPVDNFTTHQVAPSLSYDGSTGLVRLSSLDPLIRDDFGTAFETPFGIKTEPDSQWNNDDTVINDDTSLSIRLRHSTHDFNAPPTPLNGNTRYSASGFYTSPPFLASSNSIPNLAPCQSLTVSSEQVYPLPGGLVLEPISSTIQWGDFPVDCIDPSALSDQEKQLGYDDNKSSRSTQTVNGDTQMLDLMPEPPELLRADMLVAPCSLKVASRKSKQALPATKRRSRKASNQSSAREDAPAVVTFSRAAAVPCLYGCGSKFRRAEHAKRHASSVHSKELYPCTICQWHFDHKSDKTATEKLFNRADNKKQHIIKCHFTYAQKGRVTRLVDEVGRLFPEAERLMDKLRLRSVWNDMHRNRDKRLSRATVTSRSDSIGQKVTASGIGKGSRVQKRKNGAADSALPLSAITQLSMKMED